MIFPTKEKFHKNEISLAGGIYIFICIYSYLLATTVFNLNNTEILFSITTENFNFFIIAFFIFLLVLLMIRKIFLQIVRLLFFLF